MASKTETSTKTETTYPLRSRKNASSDTFPIVIALDQQQPDPDQQQPVSVPVTVSIPAVSSNTAQEGPSPKKRKKVADEDDSDQNPEKKFRKDTIANLLVSLECPVCMEVPRKAPIFGCHNGHLLCAKCQPKVDACPICRSKDVSCRNGFAENFVSCFDDNKKSNKRHFCICTQAVRSQVFWGMGVGGQEAESP
jgi:hypothetical protein